MDVNNIFEKLGKGLQVDIIEFSWNNKIVAAVAKELGSIRLY